MLIFFVLSRDRVHRMLDFREVGSILPLLEGIGGRTRGYMLITFFGESDGVPAGHLDTQGNLQVFSWIRSNLAGRVRSGQLTRSDPREFRDVLTRPDPTRPARVSRCLDPTRPARF